MATQLTVEKFILPPDPGYDEHGPQAQTEEIQINPVDWISDRSERSFNLIKREALERSKHIPLTEKHVWRPGVDFIRVKALKISSFEDLVAAGTMIS